MGLLNVIWRMILREKLPIREIARRTGLSRNNQEISECGHGRAEVQRSGSLEGTTERVRQVFMKILEDLRHVDVVPFGISALEQRVFPDWQMKLFGPRMAARLVPDLAEFDFSDRRLSQIHSDVKSLAFRARPLN